MQSNQLNNLLCIYNDSNALHQNEQGTTHRSMTETEPNTWESDYKPTMRVLRHDLQCLIRCLNTKCFSR